MASTWARVKPSDSYSLIAGTFDSSTYNMTCCKPSDSQILQPDQRQLPTEPDALLDGSTPTT